MDATPKPNYGDTSMYIVDREQDQYEELGGAVHELIVQTQQMPISKENKDFILSKLVEAFPALEFLLKDSDEPVDDSEPFEAPF